MTSPHAPTPEAITPQGERHSPHLTAVAEHLAEHNKMNTGSEKPHAHPETMPESGLEQHQSREPESEDVKEEKQTVGGEQEQSRSEGDGERGVEANGRIMKDQSGPEGHAEPEPAVEGKEEIKGKPDRNADASPSQALPLLDSVERANHGRNDISLQVADLALEGLSEQHLLAEGRNDAEFVPVMGDRRAVQDDAAVATMPPRADQMPESMGLFPGAIDNATFMAYMQTPANFYGMGVNGIDVNGPLSLPQTSADGLLALQMASTMNINPFPFGEPILDPSPTIGGLDPAVEDHHRVSAYAKLEFQDGEFYMNTYQVYLGRDQAMMKAAIRREKEEESRQLQEEMQPHTPVRAKTGSKYSKSAVSEIGGILRDVGDSDHEEKVRRRKLKKASKKSKSTGSSSHHVSRRNSLIQQDDLLIPQPPKQGSPKVAAAVPVDPASLRPSPHDCPMVAIHPPGGSSKDFKSISRMHVLIKYNQKKHLFEAEILGRNGAFIDDVFYVHTDVIELKSGSQLQLGGVVVRFVLPDVAVGQTGAEHRPEYEESVMTDRYSEGGKEMSFDFEDTPRRRKRANSSESLSDGAELEFAEDIDIDDEENKHIRQYAEDDEDEEEIEEDVDEDDEDDNQNSEQSDSGEIDQENDDIDENDHQTNSTEHKIKSDKKRGPGRPPKNGIMSKREQKLAKKQALEAEKAKQSVETVPETQSSATGKKKVGRPRIHPRTDSPPGEKREKRKYTKRKPKEPKDPNVKGEGSGEDKPAKPKKEKKPKPERSPTPTFNEAELTAEQLAKPQANYVTLIYDALMDSKTGQMSLPQLYRAIQRKYPYFVLKTSTSGWQSSVRHNLSQHAAFQKTERDGKGWMWAIVQGASIEKEKKRRTTPPQQHYPGPHQQIYQAGQPHPHYAHYPPNGMMGQPPPGFYPPPHQMGPNGYPGQPPYMPPQHMNGNPYSGPHMNGHSHPPPYIPPNMLAPLAGNSASSYSSPYAPKPATAAPPQQNGPLPQPPIPPPPPSQNTPQAGGTAPQQQNLPTQNAGQQNSTPPNIPQTSVPQPIGVHNPVQPSISQNQNPQSQYPQNPTQPQLHHGQPGVVGQTQTYTQSYQHIQNVAQQPQVPQPTQAPAISHTPQAPQTPQAPPASQAPVLPQVPQTPQQSSQESNGYGPANRDNDDPLVAFIERFKPLMVDSLKGKSDNPTEVVESAANRLLGKITVSAVPGDPFEAKIFEIMKKALRSIPAFKYGVLPGSPSDQDEPRQPQSPGHQNGIQDNSFQQSFQHTGSETPNPAVARPAFTGQGRSRPSGNVTPTLASIGSFQRSDSGGQANGVPSIIGNLATQTSPGNPMHESSSTGVALSTTTSGNSLVGHLHAASPVGTPKSNLDGLVMPQPAIPANVQVVGQKRPHPDTDETQERESKRLSTGNLPAPEKVPTIPLIGITELKETTNPPVAPSPPVTTA